MASSCVIPPPPRNKTTTAKSRSSSPAFASSSSGFSPLPSTFLARSPSPSSSSSSSSMRFSVDKPNSPITVAKSTNNAVSSNRKMCMCAPTTHPGSFRCSYHKRLAEQQKNRAASASASSSSSRSSIQSSSTSLNLRRSAMKNSLVRIGGVEGEIAKRTLTTLIRPSSHQLRRREAFQPKRSRFWMVLNSEE